MPYTVPLQSGSLICLFHPTLHKDFPPAPVSQKKTAKKSLPLSVESEDDDGPEAPKVLVPNTSTAPLSPLSLPSTPKDDSFVASYSSDQRDPTPQGV